MENYLLAARISALILISAAVFLHPLEKKPQAGRRYALAFSAGFVFVFLIAMIPGNSFWLALVRTALALAVLSIVNFNVTESEKGAAVYLAVWSIISSHFVQILWELIPHRWHFPHLSMWLFYLLFYVIFYFTLAKFMPNDDNTYHIGPRQLSSALLLIAVFEILYVAYTHAGVKDPGNPLTAAVVLAQFYCVTMLFLQTELFKKGAIEKEYLTMNLLWEKHKDQYNLTKENIELINQKSHDLKHHILALRHMTDEAQREKYFSEIEDSLEIYGSIVHTGNQVLDTILTDKSLQCSAKGIKIHCVADGSKLSFIDPIDLFAILGNAVDNAIAGVSKIEEQERRIIDINIFSKNAFVIINISNPLAELPDFKDGLPVSRRAKSGYHGYGMRSIRYNVQKYDGEMSISIENGCFVLKIVFPRPREVQ